MTLEEALNQLDAAHAVLKRVRSAREAQKNFYRTRNTIDLHHAKAMEQNLDKAFRDYDKDCESKCIEKP